VSLPFSLSLLLINMQVWGIPSCAGSPYIVTSTSASALETAITDVMTEMDASGPCAAEVVVMAAATYSVPSARVLPSGSSLTIDATQVIPTIPPLHLALTSVWNNPTIMVLARSVRWRLVRWCCSCLPTTIGSPWRQKLT
jgi:hypothetical protein